MPLPPLLHLGQECVTPAILSRPPPWLLETYQVPASPLPLWHPCPASQSPAVPGSHFLVPHPLLPCWQGHSLPSLDSEGRACPSEWQAHWPAQRALAWGSKLSCPDCLATSAPSSKSWPVPLITPQAPGSFCGLYRGNLLPGTQPCCPELS